MDKPTLPENLVIADLMLQMRKLFDGYNSHIRFVTSSHYLGVMISALPKELRIQAIVDVTSIITESIHRIEDTETIDKYRKHIKTNETLEQFIERKKAEAMKRSEIIKKMQEGTE